MNKPLLYLTFIFTSIFYAQTAIGPVLGSPRGLVVIDNYAYFHDINQIERIDLNNPTTAQAVITNLNYDPYTLEPSSDGSNKAFFIPNTGQNNIDKGGINSSNNAVFPLFNVINGTGGVIGLAFDDDTGNTYFTRAGTSNSAQLRRLTRSPNTTSIVANMPNNVLNILDVATIGPEFYFSTTNGRIWRFNRNNPSAGFTQFLNLGAGNVITGIEVTQDYLYYTHSNNVVRVRRSNASQATSLFNNLNITSIDIVDNVVYGINSDRLYQFTDPVLPAPCVVNIPDALFKQALVNDTAINTNGDSEIQCSEATNFSGTISENGNVITLPTGTFFSGIVDFTGIEAFTNLTELNLNFHPATSIDLSSNLQLTSVSISSTNLASINLSQNTRLTDVDIRFNSALTSLDLTANSLLETVNLQGNNLTTLDLGSQGVLEFLNLRDNSLSSILLPSNSSLNFINLRDNNLSTVNTTNTTGLEVLVISNNAALTTIDLSQNALLSNLDFQNTGLSSVDLSNNLDLTAVSGNNCAALQQVNLKNGNNTFIAAGNVNFSNCPNLTCIQVDDVTYAQTNWTNIDAGASFSTNCSALSIDDFDFQNTINIYPNPVHSTLNIEMETTIKSAIIYSLTGVKVFETASKTIDISQLKSGLYLLKVENTQGNTTVKRFIKQ